MPTKPATKGVAGVGIDLERAPDLLDAAGPHHHDPVGHGERLLLVVRDHDRGDAEPALQVAQLAAQPGADPGIEGRERLVEQEQAGAERQRPGQGHALLLPARELGRVFAGLLGQADQLQELAHPGLDLRPARAGGDEAVGDIVADR